MKGGLRCVIRQTFTENHTVKVVYLLKDGFYNTRVFWPNELRSRIEKIKESKPPIYRTKHFCERAKKYNVSVNVSPYALRGTVVEASVKDGMIDSLLVRVPYRKNWKKDICFSVAILYKDGVVERGVIKTIWVNNLMDYHCGIDMGKYVGG